MSSIPKSFLVESWKEWMKKHPEWFCKCGHLVKDHPLPMGFCNKCDCSVYKKERTYTITVPK